MSGPVHRHPVRVYYEDTDAGGIVYHTAYLRYCERARTEWLRAIGFGQRDLARRLGVAFVVRRCEVDFLAPAFLDDGLEIVTSPVLIGRASLALDQIVRRLDENLVRVVVRLACVGEDHRPTRLPAPVRQVLTQDGAAAVGRG